MESSSAEADLPALAAPFLTRPNTMQSAAQSATVIVNRMPSVFIAGSFYTFQADVTTGNAPAPAPGDGWFVFVSYLRTG